MQAPSLARARNAWRLHGSLGRLLACNLQPVRRKPGKGEDRAGQGRKKLNVLWKAGDACGGFKINIPVLSFVFPFTVEQKNNVPTYLCFMTLKMCRRRISLSFASMDWKHCAMAGSFALTTVWGQSIAPFILYVPGTGKGHQFISFGINSSQLEHPTSPCLRPAINR